MVFESGPAGRSCDPRDTLVLKIALEGNTAMRTFELAFVPGMLEMRCFNCAECRFTPFLG